MKKLRFIVLAVGLFFAAPALIMGQGSGCPAIVETALSAIDLFCEGTGRNQACYGNVSLDAVPQPGAGGLMFEQVGDIINLADLQSLRVAPMDEDAGIWGVALLRLQANIPDTLPGQNVTFLLFGDVEITSAVDPNDPNRNPMQAFYLTTGVGDSRCTEAPESGLLVQTPEGVGNIAFNVNGVDVAMGSTVLFQAKPGEEMKVSAIEGSAALNVNNRVHTAVAGTRLRFELGEDFSIADLIEPFLEAYDLGDLLSLPTANLDRLIEIHPPLSDFELGELFNLLESGQPPCGLGFLPSCDALAFFYDLDGDLFDMKPCVSAPDKLGVEAGLPGCSDLLQSLLDQLGCLPGLGLPGQEGGECSLSSLFDFDFDFDFEGFDFDGFNFDDFDFDDFDLEDFDLGDLQNLLPGDIQIPGGIPLPGFGSDDDDD